MSSTTRPYLTQKFPAWIQKYDAKRFIHVIHSIPSEKKALETLQLAKDRNAGYVYVTDITDTNLIYKSLGNYWNLQLEETCSQGS